MTDTKPQIQPDHSISHIRPLAGHEAGAATLATVAERILRVRRHRDRVFEPSQMFSDPAWDILLEIFRSAARGIPIAVSDTSACAGIASSSATRWIRILENAGLVRRSRDPDDMRRVLLDITPMGHDLMARTLTDERREKKQPPEREARIVPLFFQGQRPVRRPAEIFGPLRDLAHKIAPSDLPALIIRCLGELQKCRPGTPYPELSLQIDSHVERMLGIGAYESAVLLIGRTFVHDWSPCISAEWSPESMTTSAGLGRSLLTDLLESILDEQAAQVPG